MRAPETRGGEHVAQQAVQRLLIVDDQATILFAMREYFTAFGHAVDCAPTLADAIQLLSTHAYDAVVADLCLTGNECRQGLQVVGFARARSPRTRVMLLSAYVSDELEREAVAMGASVVLRKPQPMAEIARALVDTRSAGP